MPKVRLPKISKLATTSSAPDDVQNPDKPIRDPKVLPGTRLVDSHLQRLGIIPDLQYQEWLELCHIKEDVYEAECIQFYHNLHKIDDECYKTKVNGTTINLDCDSLSKALHIPNDGFKRYFDEWDGDTHEFRVMKGVLWDRRIPDGWPKKITLPHRSRVIVHIVQKIFLPTNRSDGCFSTMAGLLAAYIISKQKCHLPYMILKHMWSFKVFESQRKGSRPYGMFLTKIFKQNKVCLRSTPVCYKQWDFTIDTLRRMRIYRFMGSLYSEKWYDDKTESSQFIINNYITRLVDMLPKNDEPNHMSDDVIYTAEAKLIYRFEIEGNSLIVYDRGLDGNDKVCEVNKAISRYVEQVRNLQVNDSTDHGNVRAVRARKRIRDDSRGESSSRNISSDVTNNIIDSLQSLTLKVDSFCKTYDAHHEDYLDDRQDYFNHIQANLRRMEEIDERMKGRLDHMEGRLNERMEDFEERVTQRIEGLEKDMDNLKNYVKEYFV